MTSTGVLTVIIRTEEYYCTINLGAMELEIVITAHCYPAEPMVRYYRDGSGYPGAPAFAEIVSVEVLWALGDFGSRQRTEGNEWFKDLDRLAGDEVEAHSEAYCNAILENIIDEDC